jgi:HEAT repeat protein
MTILSADDKKLATLLLTLFRDDYSLSSDTVVALGGSLLGLCLGKRETQLKRIAADASFPTARFLHDVLQGYLVNHARCMEHIEARHARPFNPENLQADLQAELKAQEAPDWPQNAYIGLNHIALTLKAFSHLVEDDVAQLLASADTFNSSLGAELLNAFPHKTDEALEQLLASMSEHGVHQWPYRPGQALGEMLVERPQHYETVLAHFAAGNDKLRAAMLQTFSDLEVELPLAAQQQVLNYSRQLAGFEDESFNRCVIALSKCTALKPEAVPLLERCLYSPKWFLRGNAAVSLGKLGADSLAIIARLSELLDDHEGHDWIVCEAVISALGHLGPVAVTTLPRLLELAHSDVDPGQLQDNPDINNMLAWSLVRIGGATPEILAVISRILVELAESYVARTAFKALCTLGPGAQPVLGLMQDYLLAGHIYELESVREAFADLPRIGPSGQALAESFAEYLVLESPFDNVQEAAGRQLESWRTA